QANLTHPAITLINGPPRRRVHKLRTTTLRPEPMLSLKRPTPARRIMVTVLLSVCGIPILHARSRRGPTVIAPAPVPVPRGPMGSFPAVRGHEHRAPRATAWQAP